MLVALGSRIAPVWALALGTLALCIVVCSGGPVYSQETDETTSTQVVSPLAPAGTASPRETFENFHDLAQGATEALVKAFALSAEEEVDFDTPEIEELKHNALAQLSQAATTFDLSDVAPANRRSVGVNSVLLLKEILDRLPPIDPAEIPDAEDVEAGAAPKGWTVPGTQLRMVRQEAPSGEPRFLFSPDTVARLATDYEAIRQLPKDPPSEIDLHRHFVAAPGLALPVAMYRFLLTLPPWTRALYYEQAVWQWTVLVLITAAFATAGILLVKWDTRRKLSGSDLSRALSRLIVPIALIAILELYDFVISGVNLSGSVLSIVELTTLSLQTIAIAALAWLAFNTLAALVIASPRISSESLDASLIRLIFRVGGFVVAGYVIFFGATRVGLPAYSAVAGLGVGGLAIALAVRPTLENFIGGIVLYADRPVRVGDFCKFGDMLGTVESIGLRSTKVRSLDRTLVTVQNSEFSQLSITNFSERDSNLMNTTLGVRYETSGEQLRKIISDLEALLRADTRVKGETVRVCFRAFGAYSIDIEVWAYLKPNNWGHFLKIQEELYFEFMEIVERNGSAFAFPSQTTYVGTDRPPEDEAAQIHARPSAE